MVWIGIGIGLVAALVLVLGLAVAMNVMDRYIAKASKSEWEGGVPPRLSSYWEAQLAHNKMMHMEMTALRIAIENATKAKEA